MKTCLLTLILVACLRTASQAAEINQLRPYKDHSDARKWTALDYSLEASYLALRVIDWRQTVTIVQDDRYTELNKFLGEKPTHGKVNRYMAFIAIGHVAVSAILPRPFRTVWQGITIIEVASAVRNNYRHGIGYSLHF